MQVTHLILRNWRNFKDVDCAIGGRTFIIGPNASGKSNFLDVFRFLRDIANDGLAKAVSVRGGISMLRCLSARAYSNIDIQVAISDESESWVYRLVINRDNLRRPVVREERVFLNDKEIIHRLPPQDEEDTERLRYTSLEQVVANQDFRKLAEFFKTVSYQSLVPQVVRDAKAFSPVPVVDDPFGRDFLLRIWTTEKKIRESRLKKIGAALRVAVPQLTSITVDMDEVGSPHLVVGFEHWRPNAAKQTERDLSDGTLRLLGLLWTFFEGLGPLLLEEPEISLHNEFVVRLPHIIYKINRSRKIRRQVIISTHSEEMLRDPGIAAEETLRLEPGQNGTKVIAASEVDKSMISAGLTVADVILPKSAPKNVNQLSLAFE